MKRTADMQKRYYWAVAAWVEYCQRLRIDPAQVIGCRYPGHEFFPVTKDMAAEIRSKVGPSQQ
jgi:hypothetical protein